MSRAKLLSVSARLFAKGGFEATSMRDIAGEVGMLAGSMYYHFPSKNDLIAAVYEAGVAEIGAAVDEALERARGPWPRLEAGCVAHLEMLHGQIRRTLAVMTRRSQGRLESRLKRRLVTLRDGYEKQQLSSSWCRRCRCRRRPTAACGACSFSARSTGRRPGIGRAASRRPTSRAPWSPPCADLSGAPRS